MNKEAIKIIFNNSDKVCLVDKTDWELVKPYKWSVIRSYTKSKEVLYASASVWDGKKYTTLLMHRVITNCPKGMVVDHLNHNGLDNRRANLQVCTYSQNMRNARKYKKSY